METKLRLPEKFNEYPYEAGEFSNLEESLNKENLNSIYNKNLFGRYSAWDYNGRFWWDDKIGYWCMEIWKNNEYVITHISDIFEDLITEVKEKHGVK